MMITLAEAVERYKGVTHYANAYDWYREHAASGNPVFGSVMAVKVGGRWMMDETEVEGILADHRSKMAQQHQDTLDYENRILHSPGREIDWGNYTTHGRYHVIRNSLAAAYDAV